MKSDSGEKVIPLNAVRADLPQRPRRNAEEIKYLGDAAVPLKAFKRSQTESLRRIKVGNYLHYLFHI
jgi:hypothetical protein